MESGWAQKVKDGDVAGVYILSQNFIIAPKCNKRMMKIFIIAPNLHFAHNNVLKFAHFVPFVGSV